MMKGQNLGILKGIEITGSQVKLGQVLGLPQSTISAYLNGVKDVLLSHAIRMERKLGVPRHLTCPEFKKGPK